MKPCVDALSDENLLGRVQVGVDGMMPYVTPQRADLFHSDTVVAGTAVPDVSRTSAILPDLVRTGLAHGRIGTQNGLTNESVSVCASVAYRANFVPRRSRRSSVGARAAVPADTHPRGPGRPLLPDGAAYHAPGTISIPIFQKMLRAYGVA